MHDVSQRHHRQRQQAEDDNHDDVQPFSNICTVAQTTVQGAGAQKCQRKIAERRIVHYFGFDNGKKYQHQPEKNNHHQFEILLRACFPSVFPVSGERKHRGGKNAEKQYHKMVKQKASMTGVFGAKQPYLVFDKIVDGLFVSRNHLTPEPRAANQQQHKSELQNVIPFYRNPTSFPDGINQRRQPPNQQCYRTFGHNSQTD